MKQTNLETVYDTLALALDQAGPDHQDLLLAKLALLLAQDLGDADLVCQRIKEAAENLNT
jgi:hypothetical protein